MKALKRPRGNQEEIWQNQAWGNQANLGLSVAYRHYFSVSLKPLPLHCKGSTVKCWQILSLFEMCHLEKSLCKSLNREVNIWLTVTFYWYITNIYIPSFSWYKLTFTISIIQSRYAVVWNSRFHHQDHLDFAKHLVSVYLFS